MKEDFLALLQARYPKLSKGQRAIADFLTESFDKAAFMTANKLGRATGVSESTVVRFATELGYEGYPGMQKAMQESVMNRLTSVQRMEVANDRMGHTDPVTSSRTWICFARPANPWTGKLSGLLWRRFWEPGGFMW